MSEEQVEGYETDWKRTATPLTVKQVLRASRIHSSAPFELDGRELGSVYCIGNIVDIEAKDRFYMLNIEDGSAGRLRVFLFKNDDDPFWGVFVEMIGKGTVKQLKYARVHGKVSSNKGFSNSIVARCVVPVQDPHEIFFHLFECVLVAKKCEELLSKQVKKKEQSNVYGPLVPSSRLSIGRTGPDEEKDKERPPSPDSPMATPLDDSSDDEIEYASEHATPDDSSDEDCGDTKEIEADDNSTTDDSGHDIHVEISAVQAQVQALTVGDSESKVSEQELNNVQATLQTLRLTSADRSNTPGSKSESSDSELHSQTNKDPLSDLTNIQRALVLHINQRRDEIWAEGEEEWIGLHVSELARVLRRQKKGIAASEISAMLDALTDDGYIFMTIDDSHFDVYDF